MSDLTCFSSMKKLCGIMTVLVVLCLTFANQAQAAADVVTTVKDASGWKLQVNGKDYYIKGMVWGYSPRGQNYTYNLWGESDDFIRKVLDYDFGLMKAAGVNTVRSFGMIPPMWVSYIYREHGIMTVINPLVGRYGYNIAGKWVPFTDYSDPLTRATLMKDTVDIFQMYKDTPGVLMFALGNESNYGLSWSSFEIENLPEGEQNTAKARFLYSLFNDIMAAGKKIDSNHPFSIVNGDIQYIDLIAELCKDMDVLGANVYRGKSFTNLWAEVDKKLDKPVAFFEFGSDAFNARSFREDQYAQAMILKDQWQEMYDKAAGNGQEGNSIGGFVFEWRDEWWKYLQIENLDVQDTNASWSNQAYPFDWAEGKNNMNEEWFGITALGLPNADGVYEARPRMAYDVLTEVFSVDPYGADKGGTDQMFSQMDVNRYQLQGDVRQLKAENLERDRKLQLTGGEIRGEMVLRGLEQDIKERGENGAQFSDGQMVFLDFAFEPNENLDGQFSINVLANVADKRPLEYTYGDRGLPYSVLAYDQESPNVGGERVGSDLRVRDNERIEIYDFNAKYRGELFDIEAFYHTPRYHWGYEGDFFGLVHEATDILGMDIWNAKAPEGVEIVGKGKWDGLTLLAGPEVYWGANPKFVFKYDFNLFNTNMTFIHSEDVARLGEGANATEATQRQSRQTTLYAAKELRGGVKLEVGGIMSATEKVDETYERISSQGNVIQDEIDFEDTLGIKAKLSFPLLGTQSYVSVHQAGLVADGGQARPIYGVTDPSRLPYSGLGNKSEVEGGMQMFFGNLMVFPRVLYRDNLVNSNPNRAPFVAADGTLYPGITPRDSDKDPFAVLGNREARAAEIYLTWDPTGATPFYDWDNEWREDAKFAFDIGGTYTEFVTPTDANLFFFEEGGRNASFGRGLPVEDVWAVASRMVFNPNRNAKYITRLIRGFDQPTGDPAGGTRKYWEFHGKAVLGGRHILSGYFKKDAWGEQDFFRQFNFTYPEQYKIDYAFLLGGKGLLSSATDEDRATRIGVRAIYRTLSEFSLPEEYQDGANDYNFMTVFYFTYGF